MTLTPDSSETLFAEAATNWDLQKLYEDLAVAKRGFAPHMKVELTDVEKQHLRGLLCGYSPAMMAKKIPKSYGGLRTALSQTIYRYVEQLTERPTKSVKDWRDIPKWLEEAGYKKIQLSNAVERESAIASSPSDDIEALVQKVRSHFNETIQEECATLCTFNLLYTPMQGNLSRMYVQTKLNESKGFGSSEFSQKRQLWDEVVLRHPKLMVLGKPGAGKTTLLQYIALHCDEIEFQPKLVPVFISLKNLAENAKHSDEIDILEYIYTKYCRSKVSEQEIKILLNHGRLLFLLDGLDEVTEEKIRDVNQTIHNLIDIYSDNRFIVSCRKGFQAYQSKKFTQFTFCKVADFGQPQRNAFIKQWFDEVPMIGQRKRSANANELIKRLDAPENQRIRELADTPLLLHLICLIFLEKGDLPSKRVDIYREAIDLLLEKWNGFNERQDTNKSKKALVEFKKALMQLAAINFKLGKSYIEEDDIVNVISLNNSVVYDIEILSGLVTRCGFKRYKFSHLAFQEYLVAELCINLEEGWQDIILNYLGNKGWQEVFTLVAESQHFSKNAEKLISFAAGNINTIIFCKNKLKDFLYWVNKKAKSTKSNYHQALVRAFYLESHLRFENAIRVLNDKETIYDFDVYDYKLELCQAIEPNFNYELDNDLYIDYKLYIILRNIYINNEIPLCLPTNNILDIYMCYEMISEELSFNISFKVNEYYMLLRDIQQLKNKIPLVEDNDHSILVFEDWYYHNSYQWEKQLELLIFKHRDIGKFWNFDDEEYSLLMQYYEGNKLLLNYLNDTSINNTYNINDNFSKYIKDNLFLPLEPSLS